MLILSFKFPVSKRHQSVFFMLEDGLGTTASRPNPDVSTAQEELGPKFEAVAAAKKRLSSETLEGIQGIRIPARTSFWTHRTSPTKYSGRRD